MRELHWGRNCMSLGVLGGARMACVSCIGWDFREPYWAAGGLAKGWLWAALSCTSPMVCSFMVCFPPCSPGGGGV